MKICDLTQFYSPLSGGVKRYVHEKIAYVQKHRPDDEHVLVVPGSRDAVAANEQSRIYTVASPLVSKTTQYRALLNLRAIDEIIERERPDLIESSDPYQIGWRALRSAQQRGIPVVAFYHSHFADAHLRGPAQRLGRRAANLIMSGARTYTRHFYNRFDATFAPSLGICDVLKSWGVERVHQVDLGVDLEVFRPTDDRAATRNTLGVPFDRKLLLYVGRLAPEKNTNVLFDAFSILTDDDDSFHLLVVGDGQQRARLHELEKAGAPVTWLPYCADAAQLAQYYRAADLFVHPGVEETFGLVALEAQACGTPVVGIRGSHMDEVILHDQSGWSAENSAAALANAIKTMSARHELRELGREAAPRVAERYAWPRVFQRLFSIYAEVVAGYRRA
ncbi:MAG TPA: glycosyltransferase [Chthoniobacterales bacterium]